MRQNGTPGGIRTYIDITVRQFLKLMRLTTFATGAFLKEYIDSPKQPGYTNMSD